MCHGLTCIILTVFTTAVFATGLAMLIAGALLRWNKEVAVRVFLTANDQIRDKVAPETQQLVDNAIGKIQEMAGPMGYVLFFLGFTLMLITLVAFVGLCCHIPLALLIFAALIATLFLSHLILLIVYFSNRRMILDPVDKTLELLVKLYKSIDSEETGSAVLGLLMPTFKCCGYKNGEDFLAPDAKFTKSDTFEGTRVNLTYPLPCCMAEKAGIAPGQCPQSFTEANSYVKLGCRDIINANFAAKMDTVMYSSLVALGIEAIILAMVILHLRSS